MLKMPEPQENHLVNWPNTDHSDKTQLADLHNPTDPWDYNYLITNLMLNSQFLAFTPFRILKHIRNQIECRFCFVLCIILKTILVNHNFTNLSFLSLWAKYLFGYHRTSNLIYEVGILRKIFLQNINYVKLRSWKMEQWWNQ